MSEILATSLVHIIINPVESAVFFEFWKCFDICTYLKSQCIQQTLGYNNMWGTRMFTIVLLRKSRLNMAIKIKVKKKKNASLINRGISKIL